MSGGQIAFLALTTVTWLLLLADLISVVGVDATGDRDILAGLRWMLAFALVFGTWLWIAGMLLIAGLQGVLPVWTRIAALVLCPASAAAAGVGIYLANETSRLWPLAVPTVVPPLMVCYLLALYQPPLRGIMSGTAAHAAVWGAMLALSISVWPALSRARAEWKEMGLKAARATQEAAIHDKERKRTENLEKIRNMPPDRHLAEWFPLLLPESDVRQEALEAVKKMGRRQGDIEDGLGYGIPLAMRLVPELELKPTPELCAAARAYLQKNAGELRVKRNPRPYEKTAAVDWAAPGIQWLQANGCNCSVGIAALETAIGTHLDSPDRRAALAQLAALKQAR